MTDMLRKLLGLSHCLKSKDSDSKCGAEVGAAVCNTEKEPICPASSVEKEVPIIGWTAVFLFCGKCNGKMEFDGYDVKESGFRYKCQSCGNVAFTKNTYPFTRFQYNTSEFREYDPDDGKEAK